MKSMTLRAIFSWNRSILLTTATLAMGGATRSAPDTEICDIAAQQAAQDSRVPLELLMSISRVETGRRRDGETYPWPWALNQAGQGRWFDSAAAATAFANDLIAEGEENFDVGCFQINLRWHGKNFASLESMFDPETNARYAAEFLTKLFDEQGSWPQAVAAYHSRSPEQAEAYLTKVETVLNDLRAAGAVPPAAENLVAQNDPPPPRINRFPLLQIGSRGVGASLVPMTEGVLPLFAATP